MKNYMGKNLAVTVSILILSFCIVYPSLGTSTFDDTSPPRISSVNWTPRHPGTDDTVTVSARVTDDSGVSWVKLSYCIDTSCFVVDMSGSGGNYYGSMGPFPEGPISFHILAMDTVGNSGQSSDYSFTVDGTDPTVNINYPTGGETVAGNVTIAWSANDNVDSSLSTTIEYSTDTGTIWNRIHQLSGPKEYTWDTTTVLEGSNYLLRISVVDDAGNSANDRTDAPFTIDNTPPETSHSLNGELGENAWYISPVEVTLSYTDTLSGVNETFYRVNNGSWTQYTNPFTESGSGEYYIEYYSTDRAGNKEATQNTVFRINRDKPIVTIETPKTGFLYIGGREITATPFGMTIILGDLTIEATASDDTSSVTRVEFFIDNELKETVTEPPYTWQWTDPIYFFHTLEVTAYNDSGNYETAALRVLIFIL